MKVLYLLIFLLPVLCCSAQLKPIASGVFHIADAPVKKDGLRESRSMVTGTTSDLEFLSVHVTTQQKGAAPRPSHAQKDIEELIIIKEGKLKCTIGNKTAVLGKRSILLVPPGEEQQFQNAGDEPLTYYVFQFRSKKMNIERSRLAGGTLLINSDTLKTNTSATKSSIKYFDRPTTMCNNMEMHITSLHAKGPSHAPHTHLETEIVLVIEGDAEMTVDGQHFNGTAGDFFIAASGSLHMLGNAADKPCSYFAFKWR
ncbi:MAG: cupin domain-containing protein [Bacteroidetes bacterium]|nr:cupin domain-containing protein [Bacteroidota bacterium]